MVISRKQNNLILYLIVVLGLVGGYVYHSQFGSSFSMPELPPAAKEIQDLKNLNVDFGALDDDKYHSLQVYGDLPVIPGISGKRDLFAPF
ncbi:MAG: hypothetical protein Q8P35_01485 [Candidatus Yanofskybacteria bacterium]|nr:hypothetical protein [Candidatus Yanofskybacteria bacterium]